MFNFLKNLFGNKKAEVEYTEALNENNEAIIESLIMEESEHINVTLTEEKVEPIAKEVNDVITVNTEIEPERGENQFGQDPIIVEKVTIDDPYEPKLELRNYKQPSLDLLDAVQEIDKDLSRLELYKDLIIAR